MRKQFWIKLSLASFALSCEAYGQSGGISLSSAAIATGGVAALNVYLTAISSPPAGLQWSFSYSPTAIADIAVTAGPAAVGKSLACASGAGVYTCLLTGSNQATMSQGVVAVLSVKLSSTVSSTSIGIVNPLGATADGNPLTLTAGSGTTITSDTSGSSTSQKYLSDLIWTSMTNGWGPVEKDRSNGEQALGDGRAISIRGVTYGKGLGSHAASNIQYNLATAGSCTSFLSDVGVDDEAAGAGSVIFQVWADGTKLFESGVLTESMAAVNVNVNISGKSMLTLIVTDAGNGTSDDHADWANARLTCSSTTTSTSPPPPTQVTPGTKYLSDLAWTSMTNGWGPVEKDKSNGEQAAGDGQTISIRGVTYAKGLGAHAASNVQYNLTTAGSCTSFLSDVGVDDETHGAGSVVFQVWADGLILFDSGTMTGVMPAKTVTVDITNRSLLTLILGSAGDGLNSDHGDWANARLTCQ